MILKPIYSEKAVKMIDLDNTLLFVVPSRTKKTEIKLTLIENKIKNKVITPTIR